MKPRPLARENLGGCTAQSLEAAIRTMDPQDEFSEAHPISRCMERHIRRLRVLALLAALDREEKR